MKQIPVTNRPQVIIVDDEDYDRLVPYKWSQMQTATTNDGTIRRTTRGPAYHSISIANDVMQRYDVIFDHRDRDKFNNQKENLRVCTHQQNCFNTSKRSNSSSRYKSVCWDKQRGRWTASIRINGKTINIGRFTDEIEAAKAYDNWAISLFKEFANLNFK